VLTNSTHRGMAWPLAVLGILEVGIGVGLWWRTGPQVASLLEVLTRSPAEFASAELARMGTVMRNFSIILAVEVVMIAGGLVLAYVAGRNDFLFALGVGFVAQASLLLVFDLFATRRGTVYVDALRALTSSPPI
jgi:hypothetical protein